LHVSKHPNSDLFFILLKSRKLLFCMGWREVVEQEFDVNLVVILRLRL
jgi:hypothetical protein